MRKFAQNATKGVKTHLKKALALVNTMMRTWEMKYSATADLTAKNAFQSKKANCLTFTNLFISLSRSLEIRSVYVDILQIERTFEENNVIINNGHVCAGLNDGGQFYLLDFAPFPQRDYRIYKKTNDLEAIANYYNNIGYRKSHHRDSNLKQALKSYSIALEIKPDFLRALNRVTLAQLGDKSGAKELYLKALSIDSNMPEILWNLGGIYFSEKNIGLL